MNRFAPAVLLGLCLAGCSTKVVKTTEVNRPDVRSLAHDDFVSRRTEELQLLGGPFKDRSLAAEKARQEAMARFGDAPPTYVTTWAWGGSAGRKQAQDALEDDLEKMRRGEPRE